MKNLAKIGAIHLITILKTTTITATIITTTGK